MDPRPHVPDGIDEVGAGHAVETVLVGLPAVGIAVVQLGTRQGDLVPAGVAQVAADGRVPEAVRVDRDPALGLEDVAEGLEDALQVPDVLEDAVGDDEIELLVRQREVVDVLLAKLEGTDVVSGKR
jgi:hypothetical protein